VFPCFYKQYFSDKINGELSSIYRSRDAGESRKKQGRFDECKGCMAWPYMNPSFFYKIDKRFLLALCSVGSLLLKGDKLRKGR
jgi:hypothetical protein